MCVKSFRYSVLERLDDRPMVFNPNESAAYLDCERNCEAEAI
jgi:hypothetical protein